MGKRKGKKSNGTPAEEATPRGGDLRPPSDQAGISLDRLSDAFAQMLTTGDDPYSEPEPPAPSEGEPPAVADERAAEEDEASEISPRTILEALLFVGTPENKPISSRQVAGLMRGVRPAEIDQLVKELNAAYAEDGCPYQIADEGTGYRLALRDEFSRIRDKFYGRVRQARLSQAAIEVLAIVAYNQPVLSDDVSKLRGRLAGPILSQLVRRGLLRVERTAEKPRRMQYFTTDRFLRLFHLRDLSELPRSQQPEPQ